MSQCQAVARSFAFPFRHLKQIEVSTETCAVACQEKCRAVGSFQHSGKQKRNAVGFFRSEKEKLVRLGNVIFLLHGGFV